METVASSSSSSSPLRVAVLFGGNSAERETSLDSGRNVVYKLSAQQYTAIHLFVTEKMELYAKDEIVRELFSHLSIRSPI